MMAMVARRLGYSVTLLERGQHPRFAIGESASPLAGILIEQLVGSVRPASTAAALGFWNMAAHVSTGRLRSEARVHVLQARERAEISSDTRSDRINCSSRRARATSCPTRTGFAAMSTSSWSTRRSPLALSTRTSRSSMQSSGSRMVIRYSSAIAQGQRFRIRAGSSSMHQGHEGFSAGHSESRIVDSTVIRPRRPCSRISPTSRDATRWTTSIRGSVPSLRAPVSNGRCRAASCVRRRLDVGAAVRKRCDQCRSGCRRLAGR